MNLKIRRYKKTDIDYLYQICLQTGDNGKDATRYYNDKKLIGHIYSAPYAIFEPELCFILSMDSKPCGYILETKNTIRYKKWLKTTWYFKLQKSYSMPLDEDNSRDANLIRQLYVQQDNREEFENYPAHLHIDILPNAQRRGYGRKLINAFLKELIYQKVKGVHLIVSKKNINAINFYQKVGFTNFKYLKESILFYKSL